MEEENQQQGSQSQQSTGGGGLGNLKEILGDPGAIGGLSNIATGLGNIASGIVGGGQRRREQLAARQAYQDQLSQLEQANYYGTVMANPYEDITVNQLQAQFQARQQQQGLANTMAQLSGAAGGSGIAGLAQAMAQQQSQNLAQISAGIGQQEAANQQLIGQGNYYRAIAIERAEQRQRDKNETLFALAAQRKQIADQARKDATQALVGGIFDVGVGVAKLTTGIA